MIFHIVNQTMATTHRDTQMGITKFKQVNINDIKGTQIRALIEDNKNGFFDQWNRGLVVSKHFYQTLHMQIWNHHNLTRLVTPDKTKKENK